MYSTAHVPNVTATHSDRVAKYIRDFWLTHFTFLPFRPW